MSDMNKETFYAEVTKRAEEALPGVQECIRACLLEVLVEENLEWFETSPNSYGVILEDYILHVVDGSVVETKPRQYFRAPANLRVNTG